MNDILKNISGNYLKTGFFFLCLGLLFVFLAFYQKEYVAIFSVLAIIMIMIALSKFIKSMRPNKSRVFRKLGNPQKVQSILDDLNNNKIYEDDNIVMSKKYITNKKHLDDLTRFADVLNVHKYVHKTNGVTDRYGVTLIDKYGDEHCYYYNTSKEKECDKLLLLIAVCCPNAKIGYTNDLQKYISDNKVELPDKTKDDTTNR